VCRFTQFLYRTYTRDAIHSDVSYHIYICLQFSSIVYFMNCLSKRKALSVDRHFPFLVVICWSLQLAVCIWVRLMFI